MMPQKVYQAMKSCFIDHDWILEVHEIFFSCFWVKNVKGLSFRGLKPWISIF